MSGQNRKHARNILHGDRHSHYCRRRRRRRTSWMRHEWTERDVSYISLFCERVASLKTTRRKS
jgi:hypothetical protein